MTDSLRPQPASFFYTQNKKAHGLQPSGDFSVRSDIRDHLYIIIDSFPLMLLYEELNG